MKYLLILLMACIGLQASAQTDTTGPVYPDSVHITLPDSMHIAVLALMPDKARVDIAHYQTWCAQNILLVKDESGKIVKDSAGNAQLANPGAWHTYPAPNKATLTYAYGSIGNYREALVAHINATLQAMLMEQLYPRRMDAVQAIGQIVERNRADLKEVVQKEGINRIAQLKQ